AIARKSVPTAPATALPIRGAVCAVCCVRSRWDRRRAVRRNRMGLIWTIIIGFIVGVVAKFVHPGRDNMGFIMTTLLGIAGAFLASYLGQGIGWYQAGQGAGFIGGVVGALILLFIYGRVVSQRTA